MFNEYQKAHMSDLAHLHEKGELCPCGWFSKAECARRCNSVHGSPEAHELSKSATTMMRATGAVQVTETIASVNADGQVVDHVSVTVTN